MRWEQLNENDLDVSNIIEYINTHCKKYLSENPNFLNTPLYRGMKESSEILIKNIRSDRKPLDSSSLYHKIFTDGFKDAGIAATRDNSIFCTGNNADASRYGNVYVIFPIDDFSFSYSPSISDLYNYKHYFYTQGFINFKNHKAPVLTLNDVEPFFKRKKIETKLPEKFSMNQLSKVFLKARTSIIAWLDGIPNEKLSSIMDRLGFDKAGFAAKIKELYTSDNLERGIRVQNEIMITGSKYVAIDITLFRSIRVDWKNKNQQPLDNVPDFLTKNKEKIKKIVENGPVIYRGMKPQENGYVVFNTGDIKRKSRNGRNYYTLMIDNLPEWSAYPKRSQSLICGSSLDVVEYYAESSGETYVVVPLENQNFGVCPEGDIWASFKEINGNPIDMINNMISAAANDVGITIDETDFEKMKEDFITVSSYRDSPAVNELYSELSIPSDQTLFDWYVNYINPENNGFEVSTKSGIPSDKEVWVSGKVLVFDQKYLNDLIK